MKKSSSLSPRIARLGRREHSKPGTPAASVTPHEESLPRDAVNTGQQSQEPWRKFPVLPSEPLDAATPEAA